MCVSVTVCVQSRKYVIKCIGYVYFYIDIFLALALFDFQLNMSR